MKPTFILLAISLLFAVCATAAPEPTPVPPTSTPLPTVTPTMTPSPELIFTPTPEPLTMDDVLDMDEDSKLQLLKDKHPEVFEGNNLFCSEEQPNICVVDTGTDYLLYDVIQGKFVTNIEAGLAILRFSEVGLAIRKDMSKSYHEIRIVNGNEGAENFILGEEGARSMDRLGTHPDGDYMFRVFWQPKNFLTDYGLQDNAKRQDVFLKDYGTNSETRVFAVDIVINGERFVQMIYIDKNRQLKSVLVFDFIW
jgi:hypothetical protein